MSLTVGLDLSSYAVIGGGATPWQKPDINPMLFSEASLTKSCKRHMVRSRKRSLLSWDRNYNNRLGQLFCRTGYHMQIHDNGKINGTRRDDSRFGVLEFLSVAFGLVSIRGKTSNQFLCMNRRGKLYGSTNHTAECIFMEQMLENYYNTYASCAYPSNRKRRWYVALNRRGRPRRGRRSRKRKKYTHFLVLHLDDEAYSRFDMRVQNERSKERQSSRFQSQFTDRWQASQLWRRFLSRTGQLTSETKRTGWRPRRRRRKRTRPKAVTARP